MTELTKEQLIEEAKLKIAIAKCHPNSGLARVEGELFKIALASLEAEPVAWMRDDADGREYNARNEFSGGGGGVPLYAPPSGADSDESRADSSKRQHGLRVPSCTVRFIARC